MTVNRLYIGDNLEVLRQYVSDRSVALAYADPPFGAGAVGNTVFKERASREAEPLEAFTDTWRWTKSAEQALRERQALRPDVARALSALERLLGRSDMLAYVALMAPRLEEIRRVLRSTGAVFLHTDSTTAHYSRIIGDAVFGAENYRNSIIWNYGFVGKAQRRLSHQYDVILYYAKSSAHRPNLPLEPLSGRKTRDVLHTGDVWDIGLLSPVSRERLGYATQKPLALLERVLTLASRPGDTVLDPFVGGGTTIVAAEELDRRWIAIDQSHLAVSVARRRLATTFSADVQPRYEVFGEPATHADARQLAETQPANFESWVLGLLGADIGPRASGIDQPIDGELHFYDEPGGRTKHIAIVVKPRRATAADLQVLANQLEKERADIGVLVSTWPSMALREKAAAAGLYHSPNGAHYPRLQVLGIDDLLAGRGIGFPQAIRSNLHMPQRPALSARD